MLIHKHSRDPVAIEDNLPQIHTRFNAHYSESSLHQGKTTGKANVGSDDTAIWNRLESAAYKGAAVSDGECCGRSGWLVVQWEIPDALELMESIYKEEKGFDKFKALDEVLVVSGRNVCYEASTVQQFMQDHFGQKGIDKQVREIVKYAIRKNGSSKDYNSGLVKAARGSKNFCVINFSPQAHADAKELFSSALTWLVKAVRPNMMAQQKPSHMPDSSWITKARGKSSKPIAKIVQNEIERRESIYVDEIPRISRLSEKTLSKTMDVQSFTLTSIDRLERLKPESLGSSKCWTRLFRSAIIADFNIQHPENMKGLKIDFRLMCELAGVENLTQFVNVGTKKEAYFPIGFFTALGPTARIGNKIQWHLYENETWSHGEEFKFTKYHHIDLTRREIKKLTKQKTSDNGYLECYLGWAEQAEILLGTKDQEVKPQYLGWSGLREKRRKEELQGKNYNFNLGFKAGINFGLGAGRTYRTVSTLQRFDNKAANLGKAIPHGCIGTAMVYDSTTDRGWLVPKLSLLLHLAQFYYENFKHLNGGKPSPIPYAEPSYDGGLAAATAITGKANIVLFSFGDDEDDQRTLRSVLLDLNINLANSPLVGKKVGRRYLYASELTGLATEPDAGLPITEVSRPAWAKLVEFFDAVGVCSNLGPAIRPKLKSKGSHGNNSTLTAACHCDSLVSGKQVLGASMMCLSDLLRRRNIALPELLNREVELVQDVWWRYNPYVECKHKTNFWKNSDGKSKKEDYMQVITKLRKQYGSLSLDQKKRLFSVQERSKLETSGQPYLTGAVVFGKEDGWLTKLSDKLRNGMQEEDVVGNNPASSSKSHQKKSQPGQGAPRISRNNDEFDGHPSERKARPSRQDSSRSTSSEESLNTARSHTFDRNYVSSSQNKNTHTTSNNSMTRKQTTSKFDRSKSVERSSKERARDTSRRGTS